MPIASNGRIKPGVDLPFMDGLLMDPDDVVRAAMGVLRGRMEGRGVPVGHPRDVIRHAALLLHEERREVFIGYWVDANWRLVGVDVIAIGDADKLTFSMSDAARKAIAAKAVYCYFLHNHPCERYADPSDKDRTMVKAVDQYFAMLDMLVVGHFVLGRDVARCIRTNQVFYLAEEDGMEADT